MSVGIYICLLVMPNFICEKRERRYRRRIKKEKKRKMSGNFFFSKI